MSLIVPYCASQALKLSTQNTSSTQTISGSTASSMPFEDQLSFWMTVTFIATAIMQVWRVIGFHN